jgi:V8-like Glu-specific endopeptidase
MMQTSLVAGLMGTAAIATLSSVTAVAADKQLQQAAALSEARALALAASARPVRRMVTALPAAAMATMRTVQPTAALPMVYEGLDGPVDNRVIPEPGAPLPSRARAGGGGPVAPSNYGVGNLNSIYHYSDAAVSSELMNNSPIRQTGQFVFQASDNGWYRCSAALIAKSILATAGHCVHDGGNKSGGWIRQGIFYPGKNNGSLPYGFATVNRVFTTTGWFNNGEITNGYDVGLVVLNKRNGTSREIGADTGTYAFCWSNCLQPYWYTTQLGYPVNYYGGNAMTESRHLARSDGVELIVGSGMSGGSSGGPHIANLGSISDSSISQGQWPFRNVLFAVTSWGYIDDSIKIQGASTLSGPRNSNGFRALFNNACNHARALHGTGSCNRL